MSELTGFSVKGKEIINVKEGSPNSYAKTRLNKETNKTEHYVKISRGGLLFNPWVSVNKFENHTGRNVFEYRKVHVDIFDLYLRFLETKNIAYIKQAERNL